MDNSCATKPKTVKEFFRSWYFWKPFIAVIIGATTGYLNYHYFGCTSGSCGITSSPFLSTLLGGFLGFLFVNSPCSRGRC